MTSIQLGPRLYFLTTTILFAKHIFFLNNKIAIIYDYITGPTFATFLLTVSITEQDQPYNWQAISK